jgi:hypothetical protein
MANMLDFGQKKRTNRVQDKKRLFQAKNSFYASFML